MIKYGFAKEFGFTPKQVDEMTAEEVDCLGAIANEHADIQRNKSTEEELKAKGKARANAH